MKRYKLIQNRKNTYTICSEDGKPYRTIRRREIRDYDTVLWFFNIVKSIRMETEEEFENRAIRIFDNFIAQIKESKLPRVVKQELR